MWQVYYIFLKLINPIAWQIARLQNKLIATRRVRVVVVRPDGKILLVRHPLGKKKWTLPGGGAGRQETDEAAGSRELHEELRIRISPEELRPLGVYTHSGNVTPLFVVQLDQQRADTIRPNRFEIEKWYWCNCTELPDATQAVVHRALDRLSSGDEIDKIE